MSWYKRQGPKSKPYLWCGTVSSTLITPFNILATDFHYQTPSYMKTMSEVRYEDFEYDYKHGNRFAYLGNGKVAADYMKPAEKLEKLVPYIRIAQTPWEIE